MMLEDVISTIVALLLYTAGAVVCYIVYRVLRGRKSDDKNTDYDLHDGSNWRL